MAVLHLFHILFFHFIFRKRCLNMFQRASGVLMHISSLPGDFGLGCFGREAERFIDFLSETGCRYWQLLPFGPTDAYHSPYASISAFAGNINFIDLEQLQAQGLLTEEEINEQKYANPYSAAFDFLKINRLSVLYKAYTRADASLKHKVIAFAEANGDWLRDYALFMILKEVYGGKPWYEWEEGLRLHTSEAVEKAYESYRDTVAFLEFCQYLFFTQWQSLRDYAAQRSVEFIGDMPIYVALDSVDVWSNRNLYDLDPQGKAQCVAGVPPDYFSEDGQKWGQALYNWTVLKETGYGWWLKRLKMAYTLYDVVRIDHFRAFSSYWAVPAEAETAKTGKWMPGPGMGFFKHVFASFPDAKIIAEDLGDIDEAVEELIQETGLPGMRVMQFGFISKSNNIHLPHNYPLNSFAYTGTHDNNTILGWLWEATPEQRKWVLDYCGFTGTNWMTGGSKSDSCRAMIRTLWQSQANVAIVPVQDLCGFGKDTKMNVPGIPNGNWAFRTTREQLSQIDREWLKALNQTYMRK